MSSACNPPDDAVWDRLVDGELPDDERRALIASLDDRPDGWRRCALAFLESQALREGLRAYVAVPATGLAPATIPPPAIDKQPAEPAAPSESVPRHALNWLAVAATVAVAFGLGRFAGRPATEAPSERLVAIQEPAPKVAPGVATPLNPRDAVTLVVRDASGTPQRLQIPLVDAPGAQWRPAGAMREQLHDHGLDMQVRRRYAPLFFESGDQLAPMVVPIDDAVVTPVRREIY